MAGTVLILGSAPDVLVARSWPRTGLGRIVAINNAWAVRPDWRDLVHPEDFAADRLPPSLGPGQRLVGYRAFVPAVNACGGFPYCGGTMAFTAAYWALIRLRPSLIAFLGCDMIYAGGGQTHFYGTGQPDPLRPDPTLQSIEAKAARFLLLAAERGAAVVNLSALPESRLVFPRAAAADLRDAGLPARLLAPLRTARADAGIAAARAAEARLGYDAPDGRYWRVMAGWDWDALAAIDALWRAALPPVSPLPAGPA